MTDTLHNAFVELLRSEALDMDAASQRMTSVYLPLAQWLVQRQQQGARVMGINGAQGSGKSTLCKILALLLQRQFGVRVAVLSLDDFYLTHVQRQQLAATVHPLLQTRGVPGTHDVTLAMSVLRALKAGQAARVPVFDKAVDDRVPEAQWRELESVDLVLFEGWCVAARPQAETELIRPVNALEAGEDAEAVWRGYVNQQLAQAYQRLFALLDALIMLKVPDFANVFDWRALQEQKLRQARGMTAQSMDHAQIRRFIMHYERLTRHMLQELPARADVLLHIDNNHQIARVEYKS